MMYFLHHSGLKYEENINFVFRETNNTDKIEKMRANAAEAAKKGTSSDNGKNSMVVSFLVNGCM